MTIGLLLSTATPLDKILQPPPPPTQIVLEIIWLPIQISPLSSFTIMDYQERIMFSLDLMYMLSDES